MWPEGARRVGELGVDGHRVAHVDQVERLPQGGIVGRHEPEFLPACSRAPF